MSEPQLTEAQRETLACVDTGHHPDVCDCSDEYAEPDRYCEHAHETFARVEQILAEHTQALEAERDEARGERDGWHNAFDTIYERHHQECQRVDRAEAEVRRLRNGIEALVKQHEDHHRGFYAFCDLCTTSEAYDRLRALLDGDAS